MHLALALLLIAQAGKLAPVSDAQREPGFPAYLKKLKAAVAKRDIKALRKLVDDDVIVGGFGDKDEKGWAKFVERWEVEKQDSPIWDVLGDLAELGFFREAPQTLVAPYLAWKFPRELDPEAHLVVLRDALPLRATPDRDGKVVAMLAFDIVRKVEMGTRRGAFDWVQVETLAGQRGYVQSSNVRSPMMARGQFGYKAGQWVLVVLDRGRD
jgi:hypothetical protein